MADKEYYREFPLNIALEISSICNSKCHHCPNGAGLLKKEYKGLMNIELAKTLFRELKQLREKYTDFTPHVILYGNGEPLIHPGLAEIIENATELGVSTNLSTNMIVLKPEHGRIFSKAGLRFIKLSFWGDNKDEYESRCKQKFEKTLDNAVKFIENCDNKVALEINVVKFRGPRLPEVRPEFLEVFRRFKGKNIEVYSFFGSDWAGQLPQEGLSEDFSGLERTKAPCTHFRDVMMIGFDGTLLSCWLDFNRTRTYGKYNGHNLLEIWQGEGRQKVYDLMEEGRFEELSPCKDCSAPYTERYKPRCVYTLKPDGKYDKKLIHVHIYHYQDIESDRHIPEYIQNY